MRTPAPHLALAALTLAACSDAEPVAPSSEAAFTNGFGPAASAVYEVSVTNLTDGQAFTPALVATHRQPIGLFTVGHPASPGLQQIAENGNLDPMITRLENDRHVSDFGVAFGADLPPVLPGETVSLHVDTDRGAKYLSWASMLICTNDGFTGIDSARLPDKVGESVTHYTAAYDAGTEINTEDFADLVPPCPALSGVPSDVPGTGMSNPALAEHGVIHHHPGIAGGEDLVPAIHGWANPVGMITIRRVN